MEVRELLDKYSLEYKFSTKDYIIKCISPEHEDSKPSCNVDKISGIYHCWSCGAAGDIFKHFNETTPSLVNAKVQRLKEKIVKTLGTKPLHIPLGAIPHEWGFRGISGETLKYFGAFTSDDKDLGMEGRLVFPLTDIHGDIICFMGRMMYSDLDPKYKIYPEHTEVPMFPEVPDIVDNSIILVEGIFDMLNLWDKGIKNSILCGGVSIGLVKKLAKQQKNLERLLPYKYQGVDTLYTLFDGDKAGYTSAAGFKNYANEMFNIVNIDLEEGTDPGGLSQLEVNKIKSNLYG